jgi:hypothetical protein
MYYNVTLRRVHETTDAEEKQKLLHISVCVCARVCMRVDAGLGRQLARM